MNVPSALFETSLRSLNLLGRGKVRDIYDIDGEHLLIVTTDRISAFDVILPDPIPGKGAILTDVSNFWFDRLKDIIPNHLSHISLEQAVPDNADRAQVQGRAIVVKKLDPLPIEAVVRGYLIGSGWKDYQNTGSVCGIKLCTGLTQAEQLPQPIYTPASKAEIGEHDENITFQETVERVDQAVAGKVRDVSLRLYGDAAAYAKKMGIIIADTKFEFGLDKSGKLYLIDEILTPDSSRFWPADEYKTGISPPSFDKQHIRDYLETLDWDKKSPGPNLPDEIVEKSAAKYREAARRLIQ